MLMKGARLGVRGLWGWAMWKEERFIGNLFSNAKDVRELRKDQGRGRTGRLALDLLDEAQVWGIRPDSFSSSLIFHIYNSLHRRHGWSVRDKMWYFNFLEIRLQLETLADSITADLSR